MTLTRDDARARVYSGDKIKPTREEYLKGGIRTELLEQKKHFGERGDRDGAVRFAVALTRLDKQFELIGMAEAEVEELINGPSGRLVKPRTFLIGYSTVNMRGILDYLKYSKQEGFKEALAKADRDGIEPAEALVSFYAKLCYKSLVVGENANITQVRDIKGNLKGAQKQAHGSIFEHVSLNFVVTDCSRVYTHEQVRHRVGVAYSQTSGRYCRIEPGKLQLVFDPILEGCEDIVEEHLQATEEAIYLIECRKNLRKAPADYPDAKPEDCFEESNDNGFGSPLKMWVPTGKEDGVDFSYKKKLTSAARRLAPNGQTNEMGMTLNVRTLRHTIMMRTARYAEWEIRVIFAQVYTLAKGKWPLMFADAKEEIVEGLIEVTGMKMNPYDRALEDYESDDLAFELTRRGIGVHRDSLDRVEGKTPLEQATGGEVIPAGDREGFGSSAREAEAEELLKEETGEPGSA
jgi:thymidylate synthase (FAD)